MLAIVKGSELCTLYRYNSGRFYIVKKGWFRDYILCKKLLSEHDTWVPHSYDTAIDAYEAYKSSTKITFKYNKVNFISLEFKRYRFLLEDVETVMPLKNFETEYPQYLI